MADTPAAQDEGGLPSEKEELAKRYERYADLRFPYLMRARDASKLTIPHLIPPAITTGYTRLPTPYQSIGARGVNNLAAKLLLTLFPPNSPFFRYEIDEFTATRLSGDPKLFGAIQKGLAKIERAVQTQVEIGAIRVSAFEALRMLIVGGNILIHITPDSTMRVIHFEKFVVRRDPQGRVLEIIVHELHAADSVPAEVMNTSAMNSDGNMNAGKDLDVYTSIRLDNPDWDKAKRYVIHQEIKGAVVPGSEGFYPKDNCPWLPLRFNRVDGEDYGRGYVEEYQGDLQSLEGLTRSIVEGSAAMAKLIILVKPNGITKLATISKSPNGAVREGDVNDVGVVQLQKQMDLSVASNTATAIEKRLEYAFLLNSAYQRDGERVTSEEIRRMASDLDASLGGIYATLSGELQLPLVRVLQYQMQKRRKIPALPDKTVRPAIVTGIEALGRGNDVDKLNQFMSNASQALTPQGLMTWIVVPELLSRYATGYGIDDDGLVKTQEDVQAEQQQAQQAEAMSQMRDMAGKAAPAVVKGIADHVNNQQQQQGAPGGAQAGPPNQA